MANQKIKFAVIGCGHIGKRHASMILGNQDSELVAMCDILPKERLNGMDIFSNTTFFNSIDDLLSANLDIDVINIASPNGFHEEHALKVLSANKHVVVEKPMALTKVGCERIIYKALQNGKQVFCVMQNRYSPPSVWLKNILDNGVLGKIFMVQINCYWNRDDRYYKPDSITRKPTGWHGTKDLDGGTLFTQFSHFIDLMYWYFGDITNIQAKFKDFNHEFTTDFEDSGFVSFDFMDGGMGSLNYSTSVWDKNLESSITIIAKNGLSDKITVIKKRIEEVVLGKDVDIIVSEWMGYCLFYEAMFDSVIFARDNFLKSGGIMIPNIAEFFIAAALYEES